MLALPVDIAFIDSWKKSHCRVSQQRPNNIPKVAASESLFRLKAGKL